MKTVFYIAAGSKTWGGGHLKRSAEIIFRLREYFSLRSFAFIPDGEKNLAVGYDKIARTLDEIPWARGGYYVLDVPVACQEAIGQYVKNISGVAVAMDWYVDMIEDTLKDVINTRGDRGNLQYSIVRSEILEIREREGDWDAAILLGEGDQKGYLPWILKCISKEPLLKERRFIVLLGKLVPDNFTSFVGNNHQIMFIHGRTDIVGILRSVPIAIVNGGSCLVECTALGIPTVVLPQTSEEKEFARIFAEQGCSVVVGSDWEHLLQEVLCLWNMVGTWESRARAAIGLIDGQGARRVASRIIKSFSENDRACL